MRRKKKKRYSFKRLRRRIFFLVIIGVLVMTARGIFKGSAILSRVSEEDEVSNNQVISEKTEPSRGHITTLPDISEMESKGNISIDPGHGGVDGGAVDDNGLIEKDINLDISLELKRQCELDGYDVVMTREEDISLEDLSDVQRSRYIRDIYARTDILRASNPDAFISVHVNASDIASIRGIRVYYHKASNDGKELAESICSSMNRNKFLERFSPEATALPENYHLLREVEHTGVLVETGFITNEEDNRLLRDERYKEEVARSIKNGTIEYLEKIEDLSDEILN